MVIGGANVGREFAGSRLGDRRLERRLEAISRRAAQNPTLSFPKLMASSAELEGLYRWFANANVQTSAILAPHRAQTRQRAQEHGLIRVAHDTTDFAFKGEREDLGIIEGSVLGFFAHTALAIGGDETREPLGLAGLRTYINAQVKQRRKLTTSERTKSNRTTPRQEKSSHHWEALALDVDAELRAEGIKAVHIMDQEADDFVVYAELLSRGVRFVIRGDPRRRLQRKGLSINDTLVAGSAPAVFRSVQLEHRGKTKPDARYRERDERKAQLQIRWTRVTMKRPEDAQHEASDVTLNVVQVLEPHPPEGQQAVDWTLLTSEPVDSFEQATAVVDHYRARWLIEEYFKALKTGCAVERRQLTTYGSLTKAVALFMPIAWEMLRLRWMARAQPDLPATALLPPDDIRIVRALLAEFKRDFVLPPTPTVADILRAIARLGGHLKSNGPPGWITIGRGFEDLNNARRIWRIANTM